MKVLGIGEAVLDKTILLPRFPIEDQKIEPTKVQRSVGGTISSIMILLSRLGANCTFIASLGRDKQGQIIKRKLQKENVHLVPNYQISTKVNLYLVNSQNGSRTGIKSKISYHGINNIPYEFLSQFDMVIIDRHELLAFKEVIGKKRRKTKVIVDPSTEVSKETLTMISKSTYPIIPIEFLIKTNKKGDFYENLFILQNIVKKKIIVTAGSKGSFIFSKGNLDIVPSYKINSVDTLGAGDVFRGGFGYGTLNFWGDMKSVDFANLISALQCSKFGNCSAIPTKNEIDKFRPRATKNKVTINDIKNEFSLLKTKLWSNQQKTSLKKQRQIVMQ